MYLLEAQYCGVIPITFAGEGRSEAMKDGVTGVLVKERNSEALSEIILELFDNPDKIRKMSMAGYTYAKNNFSWDHVADKIIKVIEKDKLF
jgi:glycosyltransferase involved in cell wall biosynthesis